MWEGECTDRGSGERRGGSHESRAGKTEGEERPSRARKGRTQHQHPHSPSFLPTRWRGHPIRMNPARGQKQGEARRQGASRRVFLSKEKNSTSSPLPTTLLCVSHAEAAEKNLSWVGWEVYFDERTSGWACIKQPRLQQQGRRRPRLCWGKDLQCQLQILASTSGPCPTAPRFGLQ